MTRFVGIDPSTKTGFVAMDRHGNVQVQKELKGIGAVDPKRIVTLTDEVMRHIQPGDVICIEGVPFDTQRAAQAGWIHGSIRNALFRSKFSYYEATPNQVKKFVNVTGWVGEVGNKKRLTGKDKKKAVSEAVIEHYGFINKNDNIVDAYVLAQISFALWSRKTYQSYQEEVVQAILNPVKKGAK